jgi:superoxide dismutase, Cu-Zn family
MIRGISICAGLVLLSVWMVGCGQSTEQTPAESAPAAEPMPAGPSVTLQPTQGNTAAGTLNLMTMGDGVHFRGTVTGLPAGMHGFHIHETGDCSAPDGSSAGGHFNPTGAAHGGPQAEAHHLGDLGNITADADGNAEVNIHAGGVTLGEGANSIMGKAIIVHAGEDDLTTQPTGNAGARLACGVIQ